MHRFVVLDGDGETIRRDWVPNRASTIRSSLRSLAEELGELPLVIMESQGGIGAIVEGVLEELGGRLELMSSSALDSTRKVEGVTSKDDTIDATLIATNKLRGSKSIRPAVEMTVDEKVIKQLSRMRDDQVKRLANVRKKLRSALVELCPQMVDQKTWTGPKYMSAGFAAVMKRWPALKGLDRARFTTIVDTLRKASRQSQQWCEKKAEALQEAASEIIASGELRELAGMEIGLLLAEIDAKSATISELETRIEKAIQAHPVGPKLLRMPGVGIATAAILIGEVLPIARNATQDQAASYCGITPSSRRSGKSDRTRIRRGANGRISKTLFCSAVAATKDSAIDRAYYDKKRRDFKGHPAAHKKAAIALARMRFKTMYRIMVDGTEYDLNKLVGSTLERNAPQ